MASEDDVVRNETVRQDLGLFSTGENKIYYRYRNWNF
jgi:hypothetical protein